jgi:hypothetical protein
VDEQRYEAPEEALAGFGAARRFITVLGVRIDGNEARVWLLTNDRPSFEEYTCLCARDGNAWQEVMGSNGLWPTVPAEVEEAVREIRSRFE